MQSEEYYALKTTYEGMDRLIAEFDEEIDKLDPSATYALRMTVAKLRGTREFVKGCADRARNA